MPKWFVDDEKLHFNKDLSVSSDIIGKYKQKAGETINTRPIKKVVEAEARKKRRMSKKLDKARKKTEAIGENLDMTDKERQKELKRASFFKRERQKNSKKTPTCVIRKKFSMRSSRNAGDLSDCTMRRTP